MTLPRAATALFIAAVVISGSTVALAQTSTDETASPAKPISTRFKCQDGGELSARFAISDATLVAIVESGDGPHALPVQPWTGGPAVLRWSDGQHTLTWSPGVQIMWMDGDTHRMCGRGEHRH